MMQMMEQGNEQSNKIIKFRTINTTLYQRDILRELVTSIEGQSQWASSVTWINTTLPGPPTQLDTPQRRKRKRYRHTPITKFFAPCGQSCPTLPLRHPKQSKARYLTSSYGSANIKDPPEEKRAERREQ